MLRTRLLFGTILVVLTLGILVLDARFAPWYPILLVTVIGAGLGAALELRELMPEPKLPRRLTLLTLLIVLLANWSSVWVGQPMSWLFIAAALALALGFGFLCEGLRYRSASEGVIERMAFGFWTIGYLGLLSCFLIQLRWAPRELGTTALALAIFVPKAGDTAAFAVGRLFGRHPLAPVISPKKTWEGAAGALAGGALAAVGIQAAAGASAIPMPWFAAIAFGVVVAFVGAVGDLMESLIKRAGGQKDASRAMPGFGGLLDVLDSILFSAPVSYVWIMFYIHGV